MRLQALQTVRAHRVPVHPAHGLPPAAELAGRPRLVGERGARRVLQQPRAAHGRLGSVQLGQARGGSGQHSDLQTGKPSLVQSQGRERRPGPIPRGDQGAQGVLRLNRGGRHLGWRRRAGQGEGDGGQCGVDRLGIGLQRVGMGGAKCRELLSPLLQPLGRVQNDGRLHQRGGEQGRGGCQRRLGGCERSRGPQ